MDECIILLGLISGMKRNANRRVLWRFLGSLPIAIVLLLAGCGVFNRHHSATLSWRASTSPVIGYNVYRTVLPDGRRIKLTPQPIDATKFVDSEVVVGEKYRYDVTSVDSKGRESRPSDAVDADLAPWWSRLTIPHQRGLLRLLSKLRSRL